MGVFELVAGVGLFLLGIVLLMEGLRSIAGESLRRRLVRFTGTPARALTTGVAATTVIQSAHATIVIAMGLAGAGLLTGSQSIALLIGANIGTTATAWLIALFGLRFSIGLVAATVVAIGAFVRLVSSGRMARWGQTAAGFGLLFLGIGILADGLAAIDTPTPGWLGASGFLSILGLVLVGVISTILTQSSSVSVSATIAAVFTGALTLEQGAWLVIGQNIGTTSTLVLVAIGATPPGRRLAAAHVVINSSTAVVMAILFVPLVAGLQMGIQRVGGDDAIALAAFHTVFNVLGAVLFMPVLSRLDGRLHRWIPDQGPRLAANLDAVTAKVPGVAVEVARRAVADVGSELTGVLTGRMEHGVLPRGSWHRLEGANHALPRIAEFLAKIRSLPEDGDAHRLHLNVVNAADRLEHLARACQQEQVGLEALRATPLASAVDNMRRGLKLARTWLATDLVEAPTEALAAFDAVLHRRHQDRDQLLEDAASGAVWVPDALARVEASHWMTRQAHHMVRLLTLLAPLEVKTADDRPSQAPP